MKRKLITRNKNNVTGVLRYARRNSLFPKDAMHFGRYLAEIRMLIRHEHRYGAEPDLAQAEPAYRPGYYIVPCISSRGVICKHIIVSAEKLKEMQRA